MIEIILSFLWCTLPLMSYYFVTRKKKIGFILGLTTSTIQIIHVAINPVLASLLILAIGFAILHIRALFSQEWKDESWT